MLRNTRKGFTLIELLIVVVIIGILAAIAIPKFASTKDKAKVTGMRTDLRNLLSAQEGHLSDYNTYATTTGTARSQTTVVFTPSAGNRVTIGAATAAGWNATAVRNPQDLSTAMTCGVFVGNVRPAGMPTTTPEGSVACW